MKKNLSRSSKRILGALSLFCLLGVICVSLVVFYLVPSNARDNQDPGKQAEMIALVLEWGRLAPFPTNATNVSVKTEGGSFSRSFRANFVAPKQDIQEWIDNSPGLNEVTPKELPDNKVRYIVAPGGGANRFEVTIDYRLNKVDMYVSWS